MCSLRGGVVDPIPIAPRADEVGGAQFGEVLGDGRRAGADVVGELVDGVLTMEQRPHDLQPCRIGEELQHTSSDLELDSCRLLDVASYLRSHADTLPDCRHAHPEHPCRG